MTLPQTFQAELDRFRVTWCRGPCRYRNSHRRGFATPGTIHLDSKIGTRRSLYRGLHEIGHVVLGHARRGPKRRWQVEAEAEAWAQERMSELGLESPPEIVEAGRAYVARMKRWGDNISRAAGAGPE